MEDRPKQGVRFLNGLVISGDEVIQGAEVWPLEKISRVWIKPVPDNAADELGPDYDSGRMRQAILAGFGTASLLSSMRGALFVEFLGLGLTGLLYVTYPKIRAFMRKTLRAGPTAVCIDTDTGCATVLVTRDRTEAEMVTGKIEEALRRRST